MSSSKSTEINALFFVLLQISLVISKIVYLWGKTPLLQQVTLGLCLSIFTFNLRNGVVDVNVSIRISSVGTKIHLRITSPIPVEVVICLLSRANRL